MRLLREFLNAFKEYLLLLVLLVISVLLMTSNESAASGRVRGIVFGSFAFLTSTVSDVSGSGNSKAETDILRKKNAELMLEVSKLREYAFTSREVQSLLSYRDTSQFDLIPAKIISRVISSAASTVNINAGSDDGIKKGMPVINSDGLIGIVSEVAGHSASVRTILNSSLKIIVRNQSGRSFGVMKWTGEQLLVTNLPKTAEIAVGDRITTSEMSSLVSFPLPVGIVKRIINPEKGYFNDIQIQPFADPAKVDYIFVIKETGR